MNNNDHAVANLLLICGLLYIYYLAQTNPKVNIKECFYYLIGIVLLYLFYVRFSINMQENFDIFGADLSSYDSNNRASLDIFYKESETGRANKFSKSASSCDRTYSLFGPTALNPSKFKNRNILNNTSSLKRMLNNVLNYYIKSNNQYLNFLIHTPKYIDVFIDKTTPGSKPISKIYDYSFPQKWSIDIVDINEKYNKCLVTISSFSSSGNKPKYYLSVINDKLTVSPILGGYTSRWVMLLNIPTSGDSCFCTKCCDDNNDCSFSNSDDARRNANNEADCVKAVGKWNPNGCFSTKCKYSGKTNSISNAKNKKECENPPATGQPVANSIWKPNNFKCTFLLQSASNKKFLCNNNVTDTNNRIRVYLEKENNNLFNNMLWSLEDIN